MNENLLLTLLLGVLTSLSFGSFIAALTYRIPRGIDFVRGRSFCDECKKELKWYDNIPIFSYLFYFGKSRCCNKKISPRYLIIEFITMLCSLYIIFYTSSFVINLIIFYLLFSILIIDFENQIIPDEISFLFLLVSVVLNLNNLPSMLFFGFLSATLLLLINLITKGKGMGLGDVKLSIGLGMWFNSTSLFNWFFVSFLTGGLVASILLSIGSAKLKTKIAFGPFLILGFFVVQYFGYDFLNFLK